MNKDIETLTEIERLLEQLDQKERERIIDWLNDKYFPDNDEDQQEANSSTTITYWPINPCDTCSYKPAPWNWTTGMYKSRHER